MTSSPVSLDTLITFVKVQHPDGSPLDNLSDAVAVSTRLGEQADSLIGHFVDQARRSGASWSQIGASMGVTKQAAQQRFVPRGPLKDAAGFGDFSRFTQRARDVLAAAEDLARAADVAVIGREHLAAGLMAEPDGLAAKAIAALGVSAGQLRTAFGLPDAGRAPGGPRRRAAPAGSGAGDADAQRVPLGPGAVAALQAALGQALHLGHNYIGTEHILLGLVDEESSTAATLAGLGVTKAAVRKQIHGGARGARGPAGRSAAGQAPRPAQAPRTWIAGRSLEKTGMYGTCCLGGQRDVAGPPGGRRDRVLQRGDVGRAHAHLVVDQHRGVPVHAGLAELGVAGVDGRELLLSQRVQAGQRAGAGREVSGRAAERHDRLVPGAPAFGPGSARVTDPAAPQPGMTECSTAGLSWPRPTACRAAGWAAGGTVTQRSGTAIRRPCGWPAGPLLPGRQRRGRGGRLADRGVHGLLRLGGPAAPAGAARDGQDEAHGKRRHPDRGRYSPHQ